DTFRFASASATSSVVSTWSVAITVTSGTTASPTPTPTPTPGPGSLLFNGSMTTGVQPWAGVGGGAQCANYGTTSQNGRLRGNLYFTNIGGLPAAEFMNLQDPNPTTWPLQACGLDGNLAGRNATST